jgi:hypothetical protein
VVFLPHDDETVRIALGKLSQQDRVDDAEHCGVRANSKRQNRNNKRRKRRGISQNTKGEFQVMR